MYAFRVTKANTEQTNIKKKIMPHGVMTGFLRIVYYFFSKPTFVNKVDLNIEIYVRFVCCKSVEDLKYCVNFCKTGECTLSLIPYSKVSTTRFVYISSVIKYEQKCFSCMSRIIVCH